MNKLAVRRSRATSARTTRRRVRAAAASAPSGRDEEVPRQSVVVGHTWLRGARQLNDFRFQYAHAAFYGYPGGTDIWKETGAFPAGARQPLDARPTAFPSLTYGNNYDYISPESRWEFRDTYALNFGDARRQVRRRVQLHAVRLRRRRQLADVRHLHVLARSVLRSEQPGVDRGADRRGDVQRVDAVHDQPSDEVLRRLRAGRLAGAPQRHGEPRPALRAALRLGQRGPRPEQLPGHAARTSTSASAATRTTSARGPASPGTCSATASTVRARRLRQVLRPHPPARHARRVQQLPAVLDQHHEPGVSGSVPGPRPARLHRLGAGAEHHRRRRTT